MEVKLLFRLLNSSELLLGLYLTLLLTIPMLEKYGKDISKCPRCDTGRLVMIYDSKAVRKQKAISHREVCPIMIKEEMKKQRPFISRRIRFCSNPHHRKMGKLCLDRFLGAYGQYQTVQDSTKAMERFLPIHLEYHPKLVSQQQLTKSPEKD